MLIIVIALIVIIYLLTGFTSRGSKINSRITKILRVFLFILAPVLVALVILGGYNIYPRGYWVTRVLFWIVFFLTMILFGLGNRLAINKNERLAYGFLFYGPLVCIPILLIPFFGAGLALRFYVSFIGDNSLVVYSDNNIRIEQKYIRFMSPDPPLVVYAKDGIISYKHTELTTGFNEMKDSVRVRRINETTYSLIHYAPDNWEVPGGSEEITFSIDSR